MPNPTLPSSRLNRLLPLGVLVPFIAAAIMIWGWPLTVDSDLYLHLKKGEIMVKAGRIVTTDVLTFTNAGKPDEIIHSWLSQLIFYFIYSISGWPGLMGLNLLLVFGILASVGLYTWRKTKSWGAVCLAMTVALLVHREVQVFRPQVFGELFFCIFCLQLLPRASNPLSYSWALKVAALVIVWLQLHPSGLIVLPITALLAAFQIVDLLLGDLDPVSKRKRTLSLAAMATLVAFACCINPMGPGIFSYSVNVSRICKYARIGEWLPPRLIVWLSFYPPKQTLWVGLGFLPVLLLGLIVSLFFKTRQWATLIWNERFDVLLSGVFVVNVVLAVRFTGYLIFSSTEAIAFWVLWRKRGRATRSVRESERAPLVAYFGVSLALLFTFRFYECNLVMESIEKVTRFLVSTDLDGNLYNTGAWGSYLHFYLPDKLGRSSDGRIWVNREQWTREIDEEKIYGQVRLDKLFEEDPRYDLVLVPSQFGIRLGHF